MPVFRKDNKLEKENYRLVSVNRGIGDNDV